MRSSEGVNVCKGRASDFDALKHLSVCGVDAHRRVVGSMSSYLVERHQKVSGCAVLDLFVGQFFANVQGQRILVVFGGQEGATRGFDPGYILERAPCHHSLSAMSTMALPRIRCES
jgi:hypothetical protein